MAGFQDVLILQKPFQQRDLEGVLRLALAGRAEAGQL
jgi:hypothetical protein